MFCMSEKLLAQNFHDKRFLHTTEMQARCGAPCFHSERGESGSLSDRRSTEMCFKTLMNSGEQTFTHFYSAKYQRETF